MNTGSGHALPRFAPLSRAGARAPRAVAPRSAALAAALLGMSLLPPGRLAAQGPSVLSGRVADRSGLPVPGALVCLEGAGLEASTDAEGRYRITGLRAGRFRLIVTAPSFQAFTSRLEIAREGESLRRDAVLDGKPVRMAEVLTRVERVEWSAADRRVLSREDLERAGSLGRALARIPGVFVKDYGAGGPQQVSIRGGAPEQTLVLWGDERLLTPAGGAVDLRTLPSGAIDSVEVIPTGASSRFGPGALAGVVRVHPAAAEVGSPTVASLEVGAGSLGEREASTRVAFSAGPTAIAIRGAVRGYGDEFGGRMNAGGNEREAALSLAVPGLGASFDAAAFQAERGAPGPVFDPTPAAAVETRRALVSAALERTSGPWSLRGQASFQRGSSAYGDAARPAVGGESGETALALRAGAVREELAHRLEAGVEVRRHLADGDRLSGDPERDELGLYAADRWRLVSAPAVAISPAVRLDGVAVRAGRDADFSSAGAAGTGAGGIDPAREDRSDLFLSPSLALALEPGAGLALRAQVGRSFRYPEFQNLFFLSGLGVRGNPLLREERSRDLELAAEWSPGAGLRVSGAVFDRRLDGAIVWLPDFQFIWSPRNLPRAVVRGLELAASWRPLGSWELNGSYSYAPSRFDFPGNHNPLPYRPAQLGRLEAAGAVGPLRSAIEARLTGPRYPNVAGTNVLEGYVLTDWSVEWRRDLAGDARLALELRLENLLDRDYDVVFGFPAAGRGLRLALRYEPRRGRRAAGRAAPGQADTGKRNPSFQR